MKYKLIMLPNPILVSCEKPTEWYLDDTYTIRKSFTDDEYYWSKRPEYKKIIAGIEGLPILDLSAIAERIGWVDVEKVKSDYFKSVTFGWDVESLERYSYEVQQDAETYAKGFIASQSLNEKKFSEGDLEDFYIWKDEERWFGFSDGKWNYTFEHPTSVSKDSYEKNYRKTTKELLDMWKQQRKPKEYNVLYTQEGNTIKVTKIIN